MTYKVLVMSDLHLRDNDFKTIGGYVEAVEETFLDIIRYVKENDITHVISTGDLYDKGYRAIHASYSHENLCRELSESVHGNFFICLGNHFFIERDNNPEMYLIQPHSKYVPKHPIQAVKPVIQLVNELRVGCVQFSFFHFNKEDKTYINRRQDYAKYHIGIYHDDTVVPASIRQRTGIFKESTSEYIRLIFNNIDMAVVGHIHVAVGMENIQVAGKTIPIILPGSLCVTSSAASELHTSVKLPVYIIDDNNMQLQLIDFKIHADKLKFYEKQEQKMPVGLLSTDNINKPSDVIQNNLGLYLSLDEYLRQDGCDDNVLETIHKAVEGSLDFKSAIKLAYSRKES